MESYMKDRTEKLEKIFATGIDKKVTKVSNDIKRQYIQCIKSVYE